MARSAIWRSHDPFLLAWNAVSAGGQLFADGETSGGLLAQLRYLDQMVGLGHYGCLVLVRAMAKS